jgi:hypothetical protein
MQDPDVQLTEPVLNYPVGLATTTISGGQRKLCKDLGAHGPQLIRRML